MSPKLYLVGFFCCLIITPGLSGNEFEGAETDANIKTTDATEPATTDISTLVNTKHTTEITSSTSTPTSTPTTSTPTTPTTTSATTSTTPAIPITTTTATTTTTTATTTTTTPPSTTQKPSTTTAPPSTTAAPPPPAPTPLPEPEVGSWVLSNSSTNLTCVIIHMALRMKIPYISTVNQTPEWGQLNLVKNATLTGKCDDDSIKSNVSQVRLTWSSSNYLDITFKRYNESNTFNITRLYLAQNVSGDAFPNNTMKGMMNFQGNGSGLFAVTAVPIGSSYRCSHKANVNLSEVNPLDSKPRNAILTFSRVQVQAYVNSTSGTFGGVYDCPGMDTSDIVPIAVGCALAGLVIGVLIAYLVGRRRSHARGYLSM